MKASRTLYLLVGVLALASVAAMAQPSDPNSRAFMGVWLDPRPLSGVVVKNLCLHPGKGLRIENIYANSPADKAGLDRDNILMSFQGLDVNDIRDFGDAVSKAGIGTQVSLEVIQLGRRRTIKLALEARPKDPSLKYLPEPPIMRSMRVGDIFRHDSRSGQWVPFGAPDANGMWPPPFAKEVYTASYGSDLTVTIEGSPRADDSTVIVRTGQAEYKSTLGKVSELPHAYRDQVNQAIKAARENSDRTAQRRPSGLRGHPLGGGSRPDHSGASGDMNPSQTREGRQWQEENTQRMLDWVTRYLDSLQQSPTTTLKPDMDRLNLLEEKLRQLQAQIDQVQRRAAKEAVSDPNQPAPDPNQPRKPRG